MKTLLRKIYYRVRHLPVVGPMAQSFVAYVRTGGRSQAVPHAVDWEQARQVSSMSERLHVLEQLTKSQAHALTGLNNACKTLKKELADQSHHSANSMSHHGSDLQLTLEAFSQLQQAHRDQALALQHQAQRTEFIRDEVMFELRKALKISVAAAPGESADESIEPRILPHVSLLEGQPIRLNLGCGHIPHDDKLNVDRRALPGVDVVAGADNLPFAPGSVELIYAAHLLEHFPRRYLLDVLLPYWSSVLKADGALQLVVPDAQAMLVAHQKGEMNFDTLAEVTFGKQDYDGDFHYAMYSPETLVELLKTAGFSQVEVKASDRVNGDCREMEVHARKAHA